jgi:tetratricopeptide (TPR) repeat protein
MALLAALGLALPAAARAAAPAGDLPPIACVTAVRASRVARMNGDAAGARQQLDAAIDLPGCSLPALSEALSLMRAGGYTEERAALLRKQLRERLADPATEVPDGLLTMIAMVPGGESEDQLLLETLQRRLAAIDGRGGAPLVELLRVVADLQERLRLPTAALTTLRRLMSVAPDDGLRWRVVMLSMAQRDWAGAADLLSHMVDAPEAPQRLREIYATALAHLGRYDEMVRQIDKLQPGAAVMAVRPGELPEPVYLGLLLDAGWALRDAGRDREAEAMFRRVLALDPDQQEAQLVIGHLYGTPEERAAQAAAVAAKRATMTDPLPLFEQGSDLLGAGDTKGAFELLARAAPQLGGTDYAEPSWYNLGTAAFKLERWADAADAFALAIAVNGNRAESHYTRGIALFHLEKCADAVVALKRTLDLAPDRKDAHYYLAGCYAKLGDAAAAARENAIFNAKPH